MQFYNAVRSYNYRKRLLDVQNELEQRIVEYMRDKNLTKKAIPGYYVEVYDNRLEVKERPQTDLKQLRFGFYIESLDYGHQIKS